MSGPKYGSEILELIISRVREAEIPIWGAELIDGPGNTVVARITIPLEMGDWSPELKKALAKKMADERFLPDHVVGAPTS